MDSASTRVRSPVMEQSMVRLYRLVQEPFPLEYCGYKPKNNTNCKGTLLRRKKGSKYKGKITLCNIIQLSTKMCASTINEAIVKMTL